MLIPKRNISSKKNFFKVTGMGPAKVELVTLLLTCRKGEIASCSESCADLQTVNAVFSHNYCHV